MENVYEKFKNNHGETVDFEYEISGKINSIIGFIEIIGNHSTSHIEMCEKLEEARVMIMEMNSYNLNECGDVIIAYDLLDYKNLRDIVKCCDRQLRIYEDSKKLLEASIGYVKKIENKKNLIKDHLEEIKTKAKEANEIIDSFANETLVNINELKEECKKKLKTSKR